MEIFLLALLAAVAAADENAPIGELPAAPPMPHPDDDKFDYERHAIEFWHGFMREPIVLWNEIQEGAWMLHELVCPEGHRADGETVTIDMNAMHHSHQVVPGSPYPRTSRQSDIYFLEKSEPDESGGFDVYEAAPPTGYCHHPGHRGPRRFTIPHRIIDQIKEIGD
jgi:hypothetical protein